MHFLLLKVLSSVGMGVLLRRAEARGLPRLPMVRVNYAVAALLAFFAAVAIGSTRAGVRTVLLGVATGGLFVTGMFCWIATIRAAGLALSVVAMRVAIVVPVLASVLVWHEPTTPMQLGGSAVALAALGLVLSDVVGPGPRRKPVVTGSELGAEPAAAGRASRAAPFWLAGLFLVDGLVMLPAQVFDRWELPGESLPFQAVIFVSAFLITTVIYYLRRERVNYQTAAQGSLVGACNLGNYLFLVLALGMLPGIVVYPVIAAGEVGLMALAGVALWREKVGPRAWVGIGLAVLALVLIQLGKPAAP
ncbi:hypothetical protein FJY71_00755 [candidate division WOR-3 bacterium]|nr:hypothetical protein [candidate division WOR-3 bacterium]